MGFPGQWNTNKPKPVPSISDPNSLKGHLWSQVVALAGKEGTRFWFPSRDKTNDKAAPTVCNTPSCLNVEGQKHVSSLAKDQRCCSKTATRRNLKVVSWAQTSAGCSPSSSSFCVRETKVSTPASRMLDNFARPAGRSD